jgi:anti-sigma regulatory factor (Ser/Thr protein kinase)
MTITASARVAIGSDDDIVAAREAARGLAERVGFSATDLTLIATAVSEIARNILTYAGHGQVHVELLDEPSRQGVRIVAIDEGPGIADVERALQDGYTTSRGMGLGLPGAKRLMDEFVIESAAGEGTRVVMTKWSPRAR